MKKLYFLLLSVFLIPFFLQAQDVQQIERDALMALYNATDGPIITLTANDGRGESADEAFNLTIAAYSTARRKLFNSTSVVFL